MARLTASAAKIAARKGRQGKGAQAKVGTGGHYPSVNSASHKAAADWRSGGGGHIGGLGVANKDANTMFGKAGAGLKWASGNYTSAAAAEGRSVLGVAGRHALQGAVVGGAAGGTLEAAQGGSFWDGAKQGAFNGAVGSVAIRGAKRATGADSYLFGNNSVVKSAGAMTRSMSNNREVSGQAAAILNNRQMEGLARGFMNQGSKKG